MWQGLFITGLASYASIYALAVGAAASTFFWHKGLHYDANIDKTNAARIAQGKPPLPEQYLFVEVQPDAVVCLTYGGNVSAYLIDAASESCFEWQLDKHRVPSKKSVADWHINHDKTRHPVHGPLYSTWGWFSPWYAARRVVQAVTGTHLVLSPLGWAVETRDFRRVRYDIVVRDGKQVEIYEPEKDRTGKVVHAQFQLHVISAGVPTLQGYDVRFHIVLTLRCVNPVLAFWEARAWEQQIAVRVQNLVREYAQGADIRQVYAGREMSPEDKRALAQFIRDGLMGVEQDVIDADLAARKKRDPNAAIIRVPREEFIQSIGFEVVKDVDVRDPDLDPLRAKDIESFLAAEFEGKQKGKRTAEELTGEAKGRRKIIEEELAGIEGHGQFAEEYLQTRAGVEAAKHASNVDMFIGAGQRESQTANLAGIRRQGKAKTDDAAPAAAPPTQGDGN